MNGIHVTNDGDTGVLALQGDMTIGRMSEIKAALMDMLAKSNKLLLDLSGMGKTDMTLLQIICSAHHTAERMNKSLQCKGVPPDSVNKIAECAGFSRHKGCIDKSRATCLWLHKS